MKFKDKDAQSIHEGKFVKKYGPDITKKSRIKLLILENAKTLDDLRNPPGNHLEQLQGDRRGQYSLRINDQWRICFKWTNNEAEDVEIVDYH